MSETSIAADKVRAYRATDYRLGHTTHDIVLAPGLRSSRLAKLFASKSVTCGAFLTAFNPLGTKRSDTENVQAHAQLTTALTGLLDWSSLRGPAARKAPIGQLKKVFLPLVSVVRGQF